MIRQRKTTICLEGWYYLVVMGFILAGAILRQINLLIALFGMMAGLFVFNWRSVVLALRGLEVRRKAPDGIRAGDLLVVDVEATNPRRFRGIWAVLAEDAIGPLDNRTASAPFLANVLFSYIPPQSARRCAYQGRLYRRGKYRFGPLRVTTRFPLGLIRHTVEIDQDDTLIVYPRLGRLMQGWTRRHGEVTQSSRRIMHRQGLVEGDFHGLRDFRSGDSRRWVHWRTTARRGQLMVRQFEQQRNPDLCLMLDLWQPEKPTTEQLENVELAVSFAATVAADRCRRGGSHLMLCTSAKPHDIMRGTASSALLQDIMENLAIAEADSADHLPELLTACLDAIRPGASIVLISTRARPLDDVSRFQELLADPRKHSWFARILTIETHTEQLSQFFHAE